MILLKLYKINNNMIVTQSWNITPKGSGFRNVANQSAINLNLSISITKTGWWSFWVQVTGDEYNVHQFDMWLSECV
jgi:hypothetical protein